MPAQARHCDKDSHHQERPEPELLLAPENGPQREAQELKAETRHGAHGDIFRPVAPGADRGPHHEQAGQRHPQAPVRAVASDVQGGGAALVQHHGPHRKGQQPRKSTQPKAP